jgi:hypothetical protein
MYEICQRLHDNQYAEAVLSVAIRSGQLDETQYLYNNYLLFPMLQDGFRMGVPLHDDDFHNYLSLEGEIVIRFVDFDVASFLGCKFDSGIRNLLESTEISNSHYYWNESNGASEKHDAWFFICLAK